MKFAHVVSVWGGSPMDYGYLLQLDTPEDVIAYFENCESKHLCQITEKCINGEEEDSKNQQYLDIRRRKTPKANLVQVLMTLHGDKFAKFLELLYKGHTIFVSERGSYFISTDSTRIISVKEEKTYCWGEKPESKIFQWRGGTHYYAKVGKIDIVDEHGEQKWDTFEAAQRAMDKFIENL